MAIIWFLPQIMHRGRVLISRILISGTKSTETLHCSIMAMIQHRIFFGGWGWGVGQVRLLENLNEKFNGNWRENMIIWILLPTHRYILRIRDMYMSMRRHEMERLFVLLALCKGIPPLNGEIPSQRVSNAVLYFCYVISLSKLLKKQSRCRSFKTPLRSFINILSQ